MMEIFSGTDGIQNATMRQRNTSSAVKKHLTRTKIKEEGYVHRDPRNRSLG